MNCPECGNPSDVIDSRPALGTIRRRRECTVCGHRFTTREISQEDWEAHREAMARGEREHRIAEAVLTLAHELAGLGLS